MYQIDGKQFILPIKFKINENEYHTIIFKLGDFGITCNSLCLNENKMNLNTLDPHNYSNYGVQLVCDNNEINLIDENIKCRKSFLRKFPPDINLPINRVYSPAGAYKFNISMPNIRNPYTVDDRSLNDDHFLDYVTEYYKKTIVIDNFALKKLYKMRIYENKHAYHIGGTMNCEGNYLKCKLKYLQLKDQ